MAKVLNWSITTALVKIAIGFSERFVSKVKKAKIRPIRAIPKTSPLSFSSGLYQASKNKTASIVPITMSSGTK